MCLVQCIGGGECFVCSGICQCVLALPHVQDISCNLAFLSFFLVLAVNVVFGVVFCVNVFTSLIVMCMRAWVYFIKFALSRFMLLIRKYVDSGCQHRDNILCPRFNKVLE